MTSPVVRLRPVVSWPREAEAGQKYLVTVDLEHDDDPQEWPYDQEEYAIGCMLEGGPELAVETVGDATLVLHRFGGTYGPARFVVYLLGQAAPDGQLELRLSLITAGGMPFRTERLPVRGCGAGAGTAAKWGLETVTSAAPRSPGHESAESRVGTAQTVLPPLDEHFTGRDEDLERLIRAITADATEQGPVVLVTGMPQVGKTQLALRAAHTLVGSDWFPGGVLYAAAREYDSEPHDGHRLVVEVLSRIGAPRSSLAFDPDQAESVCRRALNGLRPTLLVLDQVSSLDEIEPLLRARGRHPVLIASRTRMPAPYAFRHAATVLDVEPLGEEAAVRLLDQCLMSVDPTDTRVETSPGPARQLVSLCGRMPGALRWLAQSLAALRRQPLEDAAGESAGEGRFFGSVAGLQRVFDDWYRGLPPDQARLLCLLSPLSEPFGTATAVALDGSEERAVDRLTALVQGNFVVREGSAERWRLPPPVREYARAMADEETAAEDEEAAFTRLLEYYAACAAEAVSRVGLASEEPDGRWFGRREDAAAWLEGECANLVAVTAEAANRSRFEAAVQLSTTLGPYLLEHRRFDDCARCCTAALTDPVGVGRDRLAVVSGLLGAAYLGLNRTSDALEAYELARSLYEQEGDRQGAAHMWHETGSVLAERGEWEAARGAYDAALRQFLRLGDVRAEAGAVTSLAVALCAMDRFDEARDDLLRVVQRYERVGDDRLPEWLALCGLTRAYEGLGLFVEAEEARGRADRVYTDGDRTDIERVEDLRRRFAQTSGQVVRGRVVVTVRSRLWQQGYVDWEVAAGLPNPVPFAEDSYGTRLGDLPARLGPSLADALRRADLPDRPAMVEFALPVELFDLNVHHWCLPQAPSDPLGARRPVVIRALDRPEADIDERVRRWRDLLHAERLTALHLPRQESFVRAHGTTWFTPAGDIPVLYGPGAYGFGESSMGRVLDAGFSVALWVTNARSSVAFGSEGEAFRAGIDALLDRAQRLEQLPEAVWELRDRAAAGHGPEWAHGLALLYDDPTTPLRDDDGDLLLAP
ncbi:MULTISPECIES: VMAP-C domain-containing protein [Streptomyces]|uniref:ATP-binding protein n=1 Tax=Streptomyces dengpaensis TaxID=2049881 RepID=A0ABN5HXS9_9ACTN|nr:MULTISPECIES: AAA family ATPase [Streptomyces]AVH55321.1 hypothetical protein C4B68_05425 [Streptomyces dengpaensis]PIB06966.1 hypothetical protein B1C81_21575 [Streptomyces sp. HG99]